HGRASGAAGQRSRLHDVCGYRARRGAARLPLTGGAPSAPGTEQDAERERPTAIAGRPPDVLRGILLMCAGASVFPFMNAAVKLLGARYPVSEIVWARLTGHLIIMLLLFLPQYGWRLLATRRPAVQIARSFLMLAGN